MNWVGGVRRRVLLKEEEKRRQEQFFAFHASAKANKSGKGDVGKCKTRENLIPSQLRPKSHCRQWKTEEVVCKRIQGGSSLSHSKDNKLLTGSTTGRSRVRKHERKPEQTEKPIKIKPASIHGPFSKVLLQLEVQGIESKLKKQNRRRADRVHLSKLNDTSSKDADNKNRKRRERDEDSRYGDRIDSKRQARKDTKSQSSSSLSLPENKENHITELSALAQKHTVENLGKVKKCNNQKLHFDHSETKGHIHDSRKVRDTSINTKTFLALKEDNKSKHVNLTKNQKSKALNKDASSKGENKESRSTSIKKEQPDTYCNSHEKLEKVKSGKGKPKKGKGNQTQESTPVQRLLSGAPRLRRILSLSPGRHKGQIWVPWNLPNDDLNDNQDRINIPSEKLQLDKSVKDAGFHDGKPHLNHCPKENSRTMIPSVSTTNREEELRLTLLLGNRVQENTNYSSNKQPNIQENKNKIDDGSHMTEPILDSHATSNSENSLTRKNKLSMRDLCVIHKEPKDIAEDNAEKTIGYTLGKPKLSTFTRKVYEVESGLSFARERKDKTPYLDRTIATPWRSGTYFQTPGGSSGKSSSKTPTDPTLDGSLEDPLGTQEDPDISRATVDGTEGPTVSEDIVTGQEIYFREDTGASTKQIGFLSEQNNVSLSDIIEHEKSVCKLHEDINADSQYNQTSIFDDHSDTRPDMNLLDDNGGENIQTSDHVTVSKRSSTSLASTSVMSLQEIYNKTMSNCIPKDNYSGKDINTQDIYCLQNSDKRSRDVHFVDPEPHGNHLLDGQKYFSENNICVGRGKRINLDCKKGLITCRLKQGYKMPNSITLKTVPLEQRNSGTFTNLFDLVKCNQTFDK